MELTQEDYRNILAIISRPTTQINASEALPVALLQQKLSKLVEPEKVEAEKEPKKK